MSDVSATQLEELEIHPGRRLQQAREAQGLSREQVAAELRLHPRLVAAVEENDQGRLPPATFVAGYLRSYARLMGLPAEELVTGYERSNAEPPRLVSRSHPAQVSSRDLPVRLFTWLVLVGLLVLLGLWWVSQRPAQEPAPAADTASEIQPGGEASLALPPAIETAEPVPQATAATESAAATAEPVAAAAQAVAAAPEPAPVVPAAAGPETSLRLVYEADCWTEITDATGRRVLFDLIRAGRELDVSGQAPLKVFFGFSPGVQLYVDGELFDHKRFQRRDLAHFSIEG